jgi:ABC-type microcin C transport system duplicated ATPase subunit YejF
MTALLSVQGLSVSFTTYGRTAEVLKGVSLEVPRVGQIGDDEGDHGVAATAACAHPRGQDHV